MNNYYFSPHTLGDALPMRREYIIGGSYNNKGQVEPYRAERSHLPRGRSTRTKVTQTGHARKRPLCFISLFEASAKLSHQKKVVLSGEWTLKRIRFIQLIITLTNCNYYDNMMLAIIPNNFNKINELHSCEVGTRFYVLV